MPNRNPLPATMRYVAAREAGPPDVLAIAEGPVPKPKPGEVLIEVSHAGVNRPDCAQRAGSYPPPSDASPIIGLEVAGEIAQCGDGVTAYQVGDKVCALTPGGSFHKVAVQGSTMSSTVYVTHATCWPGILICILM